MTLIQKMTSVLMVLAMSMSVMFALGNQPVNAVVCEYVGADETRKGELRERPDCEGAAWEETNKASLCDSQVRLGNDSCLVTSTEDPEDDVVGIGETVIDILSLIVGIVAVIVLIISGFRFITSGGDAQQVQGARNGIIYAIVGIVVVIFAQAIVAFVINRL